MAKKSRGIVEKIEGLFGVGAESEQPATKKRKAARKNKATKRRAKKSTKKTKAKKSATKSKRKRSNR
jgi:hypothetical protein